MEVTELGILTDANPVHPLKARRPIEITELGIVTDVIPVHPWNVFAPMKVTVSGITTLPSLSGGHPYSPSAGGMVGAEGGTVYGQGGKEFLPQPDCWGFPLCSLFFFNLRLTQLVLFQNPSFMIIKVCMFTIFQIYELKSLLVLWKLARKSTFIDSTIDWCTFSSSKKCKYRFTYHFIHVIH